MWIRGMYWVFIQYSMIINLSHIVNNCLHFRNNTLYKKLCINTVNMWVRKYFSYTIPYVLQIISLRVCLNHTTLISSFMYIIWILFCNKNLSRRMYTYFQTLRKNRKKIVINQSNNCVCLIHLDSNRNIKILPYIAFSFVRYL